MQSSRTDIGEVIMGNKFVARNVLSQGDNARIKGIKWNQVWKQSNGDPDLMKLADELGRLRSEMKKLAEHSGHDVAVGAIASAEESARNNDGPKTIQRLAGAGTWCLDVAKKVGLDVAVKAIELSLKAQGMLPG